MATPIASTPAHTTNLRRARCSWTRPRATQVAQRMSKSASSATADAAWSTGLTGNWIPGALLAMYQVWAPLTDPCCAIRDSRAVQPEVRWVSDANRYWLLGEHHAERYDSIEIDPGLVRGRCTGRRRRCGAWRERDDRDGGHAVGAVPGPAGDPPDAVALCPSPHGRGGASWLRRTGSVATAIARNPTMAHWRYAVKVPAFKRRGVSRLGGSGEDWPRGRRGHAGPRWLLRRGVSGGSTAPHGARHGDHAEHDLARWLVILTSYLFSCYSGIPSWATSWARRSLKATSPAADLAASSPRLCEGVPSTGRAWLSELRPPRGAGPHHPWQVSLATQTTRTARTRRGTRWSRFLSCGLRGDSNLRP